MMTTKDAAGRLVIPIEIRREAALEPGTLLDVRWRDRDRTAASRRGAAAARAPPCRVTQDQGGCSSGAVVCSWHERHREAAAAIEERLGRGERLAIAAHALVETYVVLTRLPAPHRLAPADAWHFPQPWSLIPVGNRLSSW